MYFFKNLNTCVEIGFGRFCIEKAGQRNQDPHTYNTQSLVVVLQSLFLCLSCFAVSIFHWERERFVVNWR